MLFRPLNRPAQPIVLRIHSGYAFCDKNEKLHNQLRQIIGSWSDHVKSWTKQRIIPVHVIRYEDMIQKTFDSFSKALDFIGIKKTDNQINEAIKKSRFSILANQEKEAGFREKMIKSKSFFRKGVIGDWRNYLDENMMKEIILKHKDMMMKYKYLNSDNEPTF